MNALSYARRGLMHRRGESLLAALGVGICGALLLDMQLLTRGIEVSFEALLEASGFDVRLVADDSPRALGDRVADGSRVAARIAALDGVQDVLLYRSARGEVISGDQRVDATVLGFEGPVRGMWTVVEGAGLDDARGSPALLLNRFAAESLGAKPGAEVRLRGHLSGASAIPPVPFRVLGIAEVLFQAAGEAIALIHFDDHFVVSGEDHTDTADAIFVAARAGSPAGEMATSLSRAFPDLLVRTNHTLLEQHRKTDFAYFRQLSLALSATTLAFTSFLVTVVLMLSMRRRLFEIAGLRALGLSRPRIAVLLGTESAVLVAAGGALSVPLALFTASLLDSILRDIPSLLDGIRFFAFRPAVVPLYLGSLVVTWLLGSLYPLLSASRLSAAPVLRRESVD